MSEKSGVKHVNKWMAAVLSPKYPILLVLGASLGIFSFLAASGYSWPGEMEISKALQAPDSRVLDIPLGWISRLGDPLLAVAITGLAAFLLAIRSRMREGLLVLLTFVWDGLAWALKMLVGRDRPSVESGIEISEHYAGFSFPSGHVVHVTVLFGVLLFLTTSHVKRPRLRVPLQILCVIPIILTGISRCALGAHWPSDVIGAYMFGAIALWVVLWNYHRFLKQDKEPDRATSSQNNKGRTPSGSEA